MNGLNRRRLFDGRDLDPHSGSPENLLAALWRAHEAALELHGSGLETGAPVGTVEVVRPDGAGRYIVRSAADPSVPIPMPSNGDYRYTAGQRATYVETREGPLLVGSPVTGERGKSQFSGESVAVDLESEPILQFVVPAAFEVGVATPAQLFGSSFLETPLDTFRPLRPVSPGSDEYEDDPDCSISDLVWVSESEVTATITVSRTGGFSVLPERS